MTADALAAAVEMYHYHGQLGLKRADLQYCSVVQDKANPNVWSSNKIFATTARTADQIDQLLHEVAAVFDQLPYRHVIVDPLTPAPFEAYLTLHEYSVHAATIQMILSGGVAPTAALPKANLRPVVSDDDWLQLRDLVLLDHAEGGRTVGVVSEAVTTGIVAGYRAKTGPCQFFLAELDGKVCAYGSGINCPNGMGMVEDLFTLPEFRGRGLASKVISHCVEFCRSRGAGQILIGSHSDQPPKHLYNKLGFKPAFVTREYHKHSQIPS